MENSDQIWMARALALAQNGRGLVSPNPMVGCVIVHKNKIIGEGWHQRLGSAHAEANAVDSVVDKSLLKASTVYVTLEPCAHHGKTPPCADLLIKHHVKRVVISNQDPFLKVNGAGIERLKKAGIEVELGLMEKEGSEIIKRFLTFQIKKRPYIILKWAQTVDGFVARENYDSKWISNDQSRKFVHKWRAEEDAILVGTNTAKYDDPSLNVRDWEGIDPLRLVIDNNLKLDSGLNLFDQRVPTICYNLLKNECNENLDYVKISETNIVEDILNDLYQRKIQSLIVEGGSALLKSFVEQGMWDEARVFTSPTKFESGIVAPSLLGDVLEKHDIDGDMLEIIGNKKTISSDPELSVRD